MEYFIILFLVVALLYFLSKLNTIKKRRHFSYKLEIGIQPKWHAIYYAACGEEYKHKAEAYLGKYLENDRSDKNKGVMWGRSFVFTEFYNFDSGQTIRLQKNMYPNNKEDTLEMVDEFEIRGDIFPNFVLKDDGTWKHIPEVSICEDSISTPDGDVLLGRIGGVSNFFSFPLQEVLELLVRINKHVGTRPIMSWPEEIRRMLEYKKIFYVPKDNCGKELCRDEQYHDHSKRVNLSGTVRDGIYEILDETKVILAGSVQDNYKFESEFTHYSIKFELFSNELELSSNYSDSRIDKNILFQ